MMVFTLWPSEDRIVSVVEKTGQDLPANTGDEMKKQEMMFL